MANLSVRGLDDAVLNALKARANQDSASVNGLVLRLLREAVGDTLPGKAMIEHHDLDDLAGTWNAADEADFRRATQAFSEVDPELWRSQP